MLEENKIVARRFFEEIHYQVKIELVDEMIAQDYVAHGSGLLAQGREAVNKSIATTRPDINVIMESKLRKRIR